MPRSVGHLWGQGKVGFVVLVDRVSSGQSHSRADRSAWTIRREPEPKDGC